MRAIAGAVVILAGSVQFGAGALAFAIADAAKASSDGHMPGVFAMALGAFVGLVGLVAFAVAFTQPIPRSKPPAAITDVAEG
jgi:hypothetical protein